MTPPSALSAIRFGYGIDARAPRMVDAAGLLADVTGPDTTIDQFPRETTQKRVALLAAFRDARKAGGTTSMGADMVRKGLRQRRFADLRVALQRPLAAPVGFRERLAAFWADHFTVAARGLALRSFVAPYHDEAIRPHLAGRFADMLFAALTHPAMLLYLDQQASVGPNSPAAKGALGLNENLAREALELHTLGVGADYTQTDVTEFAELLTGLRVNRDGMVFSRRFAEPGSETVLGKVYGPKPSLETIRSALRDIALRPDTAAHLARKLAVHFVSDVPDPDMVASMTAAYLANGGHLLPVYDAMLAHPAAWQAALTKVKPPMDYIISAARAVGLMPEEIGKMRRGDLNRSVLGPLARMGQTPFLPRGPDGWAEAADAWVTPATLAARIDWATALAEARGSALDPRLLLDVVLPGFASERLRFAVAGTESGWEGVALILASPQFNRR